MIITLSFRFGGGLSFRIGINMNEEIWKDVEGYEGYYKISSMGRIRSLDRVIVNSINSHTKVKGKLLTCDKIGIGYRGKKLCKNGHQKPHSIHRLVAIAFIPNPENKPQVNHINENKADNRVVNLNWMTAKENVNFGTGPIRRSKSQSRKVNQLTLSGKFIREWPSCNAAGRGGFDQAHVSKSCRDIYKTHLGFKWEYAK